MDDRKHPATARRRGQYRNRGEIARSRDLVGAAVLLSGATVAIMSGGTIANGFVTFGRSMFGQLGHTPPGSALLSAGRAFVAAAGPFLLAAAVAAVALGLAQTKGAIATQVIGFNLGKLNPLPRLSQMFGSRSAAIGLVASIVKFTLIGVVIYATLRGRLEATLTHPSASLGESLQQAADLVRVLVLRAGAAMLALGVADYGVNWLQLEIRMRMSGEEVREELKDDLGNPQVKNRMRRRMRDLMRQRSVKGVSKADVVVTNPTHFAVALSYRSGRMGAPKVVAKDAGPFALRIREIARRAGVPIIEQPPLARALFRRVKVGREVPAELYKAVAVVLAHVYRLRRRRA